GQEGRLDVLFFQDAQQPVDRVVGTVLALAPHFVVEDAVLVRLDVLNALKVKGQENRCALAARPADEVVVVVFLDHGVVPDGWNGSSVRSRTEGSILQNGERLR